MVGFHKKHPEKIKELYLKISHAYTEAQQLDTTNADLYSKGGYYYNKLANLTYDSNHYQVALDNYNQFLKLRPSKMAHDYERRAVLHEYFKSYDKAIRTSGGICTESYAFDFCNLLKP